MSVHSIRNIGISAHIDSGKTTLSERVLFFTGRIHRMGEVKSDVGATMDSHWLEKQKGITIQSAATSAAWKGYTLHLVDTPGHVDFTIEVERALRVLDGAVMVLCAVAGVQSQSYTVDRQMRRYGVPRVAFVNKLDRAGANPIRVVDQLREKLGLHPLLVQLPIGVEDRLAGVIDLVRRLAIRFDGEHGEVVREERIPAELAAEAELWRAKLVEAVADVDDAVAARFVNDEAVEEADLVAAIRRATLARRAVPVFLGSAKANVGVQPLLDGIVAYLPDPSEVRNVAYEAESREEVTLASDPGAPFVGFAFKLEDGRFGQLTYVRVYQGTLSRGDIVTDDAGRRTKVARLVRMHADQMEEIRSASAGDVVALFGIDCASGTTFTDGTVNLTMSAMHVPEPVVSLAIAPKDRASGESFSKALRRFAKEDPTLRVHRDEETGETVISGMGELHLEVYVERMREEYGCDVVAGQPQVKYRETVTRRGAFEHTHDKQTGGPGQWARVVGYVEPTSEAYVFADETSGGSIPGHFLPAVDQGFRDTLARGPLTGSPVVGVRCAVTDGAAHVADSSDLAFRLAARAAFRKGFLDAAPTVLEPVMRVEVEVPEAFLGAVLGQLAQKRGSITGTDTEGGTVRVHAEVPLATLAGYATDLRSATQGKGELAMELLRYAEVPKPAREALIAAYAKKA